MSKGKNETPKISKDGYQPLNEGYSPLLKKGYTPTTSQKPGSLPVPPKGGTGQSEAPKNNTGAENTTADN